MDSDQGWQVDDDGYVSVRHESLWLDFPPIFVDAVLAHNEVVWKEIHG